MTPSWAGRNVLVSIRERFDLDLELIRTKGEWMLARQSVGGGGCLCSRVVTKIIQLAKCLQNRVNRHGSCMVGECYEWNVLYAIDETD